MNNGLTLADGPENVTFHNFTLRKRSLGQGNIFTGVCQSFCPRGGGRLMMSLPVWLPGPMFLPGGLPHTRPPWTEPPTPVR